MQFITAPSLSFTESDSQPVMQPVTTQPLSQLIQPPYLTIQSCREIVRSSKRPICLSFTHEATPSCSLATTGPVSRLHPPACMTLFNHSVGYPVHEIRQSVVYSAMQPVNTQASRGRREKGRAEDAKTEKRKDRF